MILPNFVSAATLLDFNEPGASGTTWPGWTWGTNVDGYGGLGWTKDSGRSYGGDWYPRTHQLNGYGSNPQATLITNDRAPSSATGAALQVSSATIPTWWFLFGDAWGTSGYANTNTNRWSMYLRFQGLPASGLTSGSLRNFNVEIGTYLCWPGGGYGGESCPKEANAQHYYHQLNIPNDAWLHVLLDKHPSHQRGMPGADAPDNDPAGPSHPYYQYMNAFYIEASPYSGITNGSYKVDEMTVYAGPTDENEVSVNNLWIGYFPATGKWQVGFDDLSFAPNYNNNSVSKHEIRWSTSPITNANWSLANTVAPEYNRYSTTNSFRRPDSWVKVTFTQFDLPAGIETNNNKIYFAIKDVSSTADGDGHNAPSSSVKTIDYDIPPGGGSSDTIAPAAPSGVSVS